MVNIFLSACFVGNVWCLIKRQRVEFWISARDHYVPSLAGGDGLRLLFCLFYSSAQRGGHFYISLTMQKIFQEMFGKFRCCSSISKVLRPGVLWFLRNLNDPDFNPVQEMIHLPIYRHLRRFILSVVSKRWNGNAIVLQEKSKVSRVSEIY